MLLNPSFLLSISRTLISIYPYYIEIIIHIYIITDMYYFKCFHKPSIVDNIKRAYIDHQDFDESKRLMIVYLSKKKYIHPVANMHFDNLTTQPLVKTPDMLLEHDYAYEWIVKYHSKTSSKHSFSCFF